MEIIPETVEAIQPLSLEGFWAKVQKRVKSNPYPDETFAQSIINVLYFVRQDIYDIIEKTEKDYVSKKDKKGNRTPESFKGPDIWYLNDKDCDDKHPKYKLFLDLLNKHW